jgi:hypothetical protein
MHRDLAALARSVAELEQGTDGDFASRECRGASVGQTPRWDLPSCGRAAQLKPRPVAAIHQSHRCRDFDWPLAEDLLSPSRRR